MSQEGRAGCCAGAVSAPGSAIARVVAAEGVGSRTADELVLLDAAGIRDGELLGGVVDAALTRRRRRARGGLGAHRARGTVGGGQAAGRAPAAGAGGG